jgi:hypothetical protein
MTQPSPPDGPDERGVIEIVEAIIDDTRDLVGAHVEALRSDMTERLSSLGATLTLTLLAFSVLIVTALLLGIALAMTLIAIGLPVWAAFWIVTVATASLGVGLVRRALRKARDTGNVAGQAAGRIKDDVAWISDVTSRAAREQREAAGPVKSEQDRKIGS